uniref:Putative ovule protein n=1 Tax=Solanum chacoense TaxID=4108 RepID=A0A0V0GIA3_SOLCH
MPTFYRLMKGNHKQPCARECLLLQNSIYDYHFQVLIKRIINFRYALFYVQISSHTSCGGVAMMNIIT